MNTSGEQERIAAVCSHPSPYFLARVGAVARSGQAEITYVALSDRVKIRDWRANTEGLPFEVTTLFDTPYQDLPTGQVWQRLRSEIERLQPTVLGVLGYDEAIYRRAARWAKMHEVLSLTFWESWRGDRRRSWWREQLKRRLVTRLFDGAFVGGERAQRYAESLGIPPNRIVRGYDVVDTPYFVRAAAEARAGAAQLRPALGLPERYFLYVGRLSPEKNLPSLLRAYGAYRRAAPEGWSLLVVGSGPQESDLRQLADELELPDVYWPGFQQLDALPRLYALGSCFILPSTSEPWGLVVNEAMSAGLPVIVSERCGCVPELVREGVNGFVFDPWDEAALTHTMARVSSDECNVDEMGRASQQIIGGHTPDTWAAQFLELIRVVRSAEGASP